MRSGGDKGEYLEMFLMLMVTLLCASGQDESTQTAPVSVSLFFTDAHGTSHAIVFGVHPDATDGYDVSLGELPVPPVPFDEMFDVRFVGPPGIERNPATGSYLDIRKLHSPDQADTFHVTARTQIDAYPLSMRWDPAAVSAERMTLVFMQDDVRHVIDMAQQGSWDIPDRSVATFQIVVIGMVSLSSGLNP